VCDSEGDAVVPSREVSKFIGSLSSKLEGSGVDCSSRMWATVPHCEMLRNDPEGYESEIVSFLQKLRLRA